MQRRDNTALPRCVYINGSLTNLQGGRNSLRLLYMEHIVVPINFNQFKQD
jgi:hypothetical protein